MATTLKDVEAEEARILKEADKIERAEKRIDREEALILRSEGKVVKALKNNPFRSLTIDDGLTKREFRFLRMFFLHRAAKYRLLFATLGTIGVVLVWRGVWHTADEIPVLRYSLVSLGVGLFLIWVLRKYTNLH